MEALTSWLIQHLRHTLFDLASDLEGSVGKVECLTALLSRLADDAGDGQDALILHHLLLTVQGFHRDQKAIVDRLYAKATADKATPDFAVKLSAFTGYDAAVKVLPNGASDAEIEQADDNRFDALAGLMEAKPQNASEAASHLRVIIAQQPDFLSGDTPTEQVIRAGLANVLAAVERLAAEGR